MVATAMHLVSVPALMERRDQDVSMVSHFIFN